MPLPHLWDSSQHCNDNATQNSKASSNLFSLTKGYAFWGIQEAYRKVFGEYISICTGIPVVIFAIVLAFGARWLGKMFERVTQVERWMRVVTGVVFIGVGIYMSLVHVYRVL